MGQKQGGDFIEPAHFPLRDLIGWRTIEANAGRATLEMDVGEKHLSPIGLVHGAIAFSLLDTAMGTAVVSTLPESEYTTTIEISIGFLKAVREGKLTGTARVVGRFGRVIHLEAKASVDGEEIALASGSFLVSKKGSTKGGRIIPLQ